MKSLRFVELEGFFLNQQSNLNLTFLQCNWWLLNFQARLVDIFREKCYHWFSKSKEESI